MSFRKFHKRSKNDAVDNVKLPKAQRRMLEMSEDDIKHGRTISQEAMDKKDLRWLDEL
jgi:hypothetical protein